MKVLSSMSTYSTTPIQEITEMCRKQSVPLFSNSLSIKTGWVETKLNETPLHS